MGNEQQRSANRSSGGYYTALPTGGPASVPAAGARTSTPPSSSHNLASRPPSSQQYHQYYQPSAPPAPPVASSSAYSNASFQYYEDESSARSREERASAMAAKVAKYKVKKRVSEQSKAANWKKYDDLSKVEEQNKQISSTGYRLADGSKVSSKPPNSSSATVEQKNATATSAEQTDDDVFEQQIAAMSAKVRKMPLSTVTLLKKILGNVLKPPSDSNSSSGETDPMKFRRLKVTNEKIAKEIINVDGAMQLLLGVGFDAALWNGEKVLIFHLKTPTDLVEVALEQLNELFPDSNSNSNSSQSASANVTPNSTNTTLKKPPAK